jgi:hypothetical protein
VAGRFIRSRDVLSIIFGFMMFGNSHNARFPSEFLITLLIIGYVINIQRETYVLAVHFARPLTVAESTKCQDT